MSRPTSNESGVVIRLALQVRILRAKVSGLSRNAPEKVAADLRREREVSGQEEKQSGEETSMVVTPFFPSVNGSGCGLWQ